MHVRALALVCGIAASSVAYASSMSEWNLIVRGNLTSTSEVDGSAIIGGNLTGTSNYAVQGVTASNGAGLAVGGNITAGFNVQINNGGDLRIAGSAMGTVNLNGGGSNISDPSVPAQVNAIFTELEWISAHLASLPANGSLSGAGHFSASPVMMGGQLVAVYNVHQDALQSFGQLTLAIGAAQSVIINVMADANGLVDLVAPPNILSDFSQANSSRILWNFPDATTLRVNNSFHGAALAPHAALELLGGGMNGTVVVDSVTTMNAEVRRFTYTGYLPAPGAAGVFALAGVVVARRRRAA